MKKLIDIDVLSTVEIEDFIDDLEKNRCCQEWFECEIGGINEIFNAVSDREDLLTTLEDKLISRACMCDMYEEWMSTGY